MAKKRKNAAALALTKLRLAKLTDEQRSEIARKGGLARMKSMTPEQRVAMAKLGGRPRKSARRRTRHAQ